MAGPGAAITGWGTALPDTVVTNADLERRLDTSDAWIVERSGIRERRIGGTTGGLAVEAGRAALKDAGSTLVVAGSQPPVRRLLELTGTDEMLSLADSREAALAEL